MELLGYIPLPDNIKPGGFDHAAVHGSRALLYVAHTANNAIDVIDCDGDTYLRSIPGLTGVAGALVAEEQDRVFTSNRGENTVGIFSVDDVAGLVKVAVGVRPNGLAYDAGRNVLLAANVGDPAMPDSHTVSLVDVASQALIGNVRVPGRTRWTIYDAVTDAFFVNIADPAQIIVLDAADPTHVARAYAVPATGPHGLDLDAQRGRLFCACDGMRLVALDARSGAIQEETDLCGVPDVIFFNARLKRLYVAIGDPGVIEVFDTDTLGLIETVTTEAGAHTIAFDALRNKVYAFMPQSHRASVYQDGNT
jgi:DNA-binding beta-propeller fold protein YncE